MVGCGNVGAAAILLNPAGAGSIVKTFAGLGGTDEIWYDPTTKEFYVTGNNGTNTTRFFDVITDAALGGNITQTVDLPTTTSAHSITVDPFNGDVFVALAGTAGPTGVNPCPRELSRIPGCIAVFGPRRRCRSPAACRFWSSGWPAWWASRCAAGFSSNRRVAGLEDEIQAGACSFGATRPGARQCLPTMAQTIAVSARCVPNCPSRLRLDTTMPRWSPTVPPAQQCRGRRTAERRPKVHRSLPPPSQARCRRPSHAACGSASPFRRPRKPDTHHGRRTRRWSGGSVLAPV